MLSFATLWLATRLGVVARGRRHDLGDGVNDSYGVIVGATLTLLGLIIGFTFSMALSRYDQRKNLEEAEANAIGTELLRADLLPAAEAQRVRSRHRPLRWRSWA